MPSPTQKARVRWHAVRLTLVLLTATLMLLVALLIAGDITVRQFGWVVALLAVAIPAVYETSLRAAGPVRRRQFPPFTNLET